MPNWWIILGILKFWLSFLKSYHIPSNTEMKISVPSPHLDQLTSFFFTIFNVVIENRNYLLLYVTVKKHETQKVVTLLIKKKKRSFSFQFQTPFRHAFIYIIKDCSIIKYILKKKKNNHRAPEFISFLSHFRLSFSLCVWSSGTSKAPSLCFSLFFFWFEKQKNYRKEDFSEVLSVWMASILALRFMDFIHYKVQTQFSFCFIYFVYI